MEPLWRSGRIDGFRRFTLAESTSLRARLAVKNLSVSYGGNTVVRDVSLAVQPGEAVALLGRNGAGKTTTLMAIAGAVPLAAGSVEIDGVSVAKLPAHAIARRGLTLVPGVAERVYVLERGQVVHEGPADKFREDRDLQKRYLGV